MSDDIESRLASVERLAHSLRSEYRSVSDRLKIVERAVRELGDERGSGDELCDEFRTALDTANAHVDTLVEERARLKEQLDLAFASRAEAEALIVAMSMLHKKLRDQFLRADPNNLIEMAVDEIGEALRASPTYRAAQTRLHVRTPDPSEEDA